MAFQFILCNKLQFFRPINLFVRMLFQIYSLYSFQDAYKFKLLLSFVSVTKQ